MNWRNAVRQCAEAGEPHVLCTVLAASGSTPREAGAKMVVTAERIYDTIGGGQLEHLVIEAARGSLVDARSGQQITNFPLAAAANQCCGGSVTVLFESFVDQLRVTLFGAGHVAREIRTLLLSLDARVRCIDNRAQIDGTDASTYEYCEDPVAATETLKPADHVLIMTHDHQLDYALVKALLRRGHLSIGLIGSDTKWARFSARLSDEGVSPAALARVRCPVGVAGIARKQPAAVAMSIVTELLQLDNAAPGDTLSWRQIKTSLVREGSNE